MRLVRVVVLFVLSFAAAAHAAGQQRVAVVVTGDKSSQIQASIVKIVEQARWKSVGSSSDAHAVIKGEVVKKKGHGAHLRLKVHKGADGPVIASVDVRIGKKAKLDAKNRKTIAKKLTAALGTIKDTPKAAAAEPVAAAEPKASPPPPPKRSGKPSAQLVDDEVPPGMK